jgi:superoxide dismutase, Fe-Mn family
VRCIQLPGRRCLDPCSPAADATASLAPMLSRLASTGGAALRSASRSRAAAAASSAARPAHSTAAAPSTTFALPKLPYAYDALEPHFDAMTMEIHHKRHHQTYISNLNGLVSGAASEQLSGASLADIQKAAASLPEAVQTPVVNSGGGHYNHTLWWSTLRADAPPAPPAELRAKIDADFGEFDAMKKQFEDAAAKHFGSGWTWLSLAADGKLFISSTPNQQNPLMEGLVDQPGTPILGTCWIRGALDAQCASSRLVAGLKLMRPRLPYVSCRSARDAAQVSMFGVRTPRALRGCAGSRALGPVPRTDTLCRACPRRPAPPLRTRILPTVPKPPPGVYQGVLERRRLGAGRQVVCVGQERRDRCV